MRTVTSLRLCSRAPRMVIQLLDNVAAGYQPRRTNTSSEHRPCRPRQHGTRQGGGRSGVGLFGGGPPTPHPRHVAGRAVGPIGLGCMGMSFAYTPSTRDDDASVAVLQRALDAG